MFFRKDSFPVHCTASLGRLTKIRIGHDNTGFGAAWFLDKVIGVNFTFSSRYLLRVNVVCATPEFLANLSFWKRPKFNNNNCVWTILPSQSNYLTYLNSHPFQETQLVLYHIVSWTVQITLPISVQDDVILSLIHFTFLYYLFAIGL